ncbi:CIA30 family protein [Marivita sp. GX14005]|uniref:CIA30 family protein n=1 Tax=Marivita sp. GX14005 TaxID=2942276 RepID=UPI002019A0DD|nr:CIA30 family protein [Marivita sp. GX14005]MCL3881362.1 CIA30 family protein [Marivita sp. GX14005]
MKRILAVAAILMAGQATGQTFDDFSGDAAARWDYVADRVMGGVSEGGAEIAGTGENAVLRLRGQVSTDNNGGFIQVRRRFAQSWPESAEGLSLTVKGNGQDYYVFLKTPDLSRVWYSYRATFTATDDWRTVQLPFAAFEPSHEAMPQSFAPTAVRSLAIVAYGADFEADVSVKRIEFY